MRVAAIALVLLMAMAAAQAATPDGFEPPSIEKPNYWIAIGVAVGALLAVSVVAFKNAKRSHLD